MSLFKCFQALALIFVVSLSSQSLFAENKFEPNLESFEANYQFPEWYQDAKFGIWAHWGPQAVPRMGDWYAQRMYFQGWDQYEYHLKHYGHPTKNGYRALLADWQAQRWDPDALMKLYKRAGARYFVSMGVHHDNFFLWDSKIHRWNSVQIGPKKDVVGLWQKAAKNEGLAFGISEHLGASYTWWRSSHGADKEGPLAGIAYDGENPEFQDLYHKKPAEDDTEWFTKDRENQKKWLECIKEMIDLYNPELIYSDGGLAFDQFGREMISHFYNRNIQGNDGELTAVYTCKSGEAKPYWVLDFERGKLEGISKYPWQTDSSIGDWFYKDGYPYKESTEIIQMLVDIVSKNGNLLLNIVQTPEGDLDTEVVKTLEELAVWFEDNGEGIHGTRPWKVYGEGPSTEGERESGNHGGIKETEGNALTSSDFRFTEKKGVLYAFCMDWAGEGFLIKSVGKSSRYMDQPLRKVSMLGSSDPLEWEQLEEGLVIQSPKRVPKYKVICFKLEF